MSQPLVASYCTTFLKKEMRHIYRQVTGLRRFRTFVITRERMCAEDYPFEDIELLPPPSVNLLWRFAMKFIAREDPLFYRGELGQLREVFARRKPDVLHVYFGHTGAHLARFLEETEVPVVVSFHGVDLTRRENRPRDRERYARMFRAATLVMARSRALADAVVEAGCPSEKIRLNRTSIPVENFSFVERVPPEDGAWRFIQACRIIAKKGLDVTLEAFAVFRREFPRSSLVIAGEGPLLPDLQEQARRLGIEDAVRFAGFLSEEELRREFAAAHLFLHPSRSLANKDREGIPNSLLEAMCTGLPVLATEHSGIPEVVVHGVNGFLCPENDVSRLVENMREATADTARYRVISQAASDSVRREYSSERQIENLENIYAEAIRLRRNKE